MAIKYRLYQDNREKSPQKGKWYAKAVPDEVVDTDQLAELIQRNSSMKRSDVLAVLTELSEVLRDQLLTGNRVKINGMGSFKVGFSSKPADTRAEWVPTTHVTSTRINFQPETMDTYSGGKRTRSAAALQGIEFTELRGYDDGKEGGTSTGGGTTEPGGGEDPLG